MTARLRIKLMGESQFITNNFTVEETYDKVHRSRPVTEGSIALNKNIGFRLVNYLREPSQRSGISRCPADVLQRENNLESLNHSFLSIVNSQTCVKTCSIYVSKGKRFPTRVNNCRIREVQGLIVTRYRLEAAPERITKLLTLTWALRKLA